METLFSILAFLFSGLSLFISVGLFIIEKINFGSAKFELINSNYIEIANGKINIGIRNVGTSVAENVSVRFGNDLVLAVESNLRTSEIALFDIIGLYGYLDRVGGFATLTILWKERFIGSIYKPEKRQVIKNHIRYKIKI